jgi:catechol 2,3-dioxygenase
LSDPDGNGLELAWDRSEDEWPRDEEGHLTFRNRRLDLEGLLKEGA